MWELKESHGVGDLGFDPLRQARERGRFPSMQTKELNNGRLAMPRSPACSRGGATGLQPKVPPPRRRGRRFRRRRGGGGAAGGRVKQPGRRDAVPV